MKYHFVGYAHQAQFYINILSVFKLDFMKCFIHIVKYHVLDSFDTLATNTQNFSRKVGTERRREIQRTGREIFVLSESTISFTL